jgi:hypothetical protein
VATQLAIVATQMRVLTLGRAPLGWPLTEAYYVTGVSDATVFSTQSHFEFAFAQLAADLALFAGGYLAVILALRFAWIASKPEPRILEG